MSKLHSVFIFVAVVCSVFCGSALAQNTLVNCSDAESLNFNTSLSGSWFELARNPAPNPVISCVKLDLTRLSDNSTLNISTTYSDTPKTLWKNHTINVNVTLNESNKYGYNITVNLGNILNRNITYKLLSTDYNNYAFVCGYTNASDSSTSFASIWTRDRMLNATELNKLEGMAAAANYSNFQNGSMSKIIQSSACYTSAAATSTLPVMSIMFATIYVLLKAAN